MVDPSADILQVATKSASYNILLQIVFRMVTFVLNAFILRFVTRDVLGLINVRLLLLYTTIQFLSREPFRRANISDAKSNKWFQVVNLTWLTVPISVVIGSFLSLVWCYALSQPHPALSSQYHFAVVSVFISVVVEMLAEPVYLFGLLNSFIRLRLLIDGIFLTTRCTLMAVFIPKFPDHAVLVFAAAQLIASLLYTLLYYILTLRTSTVSFNSFLPKKDDKNPMIDFFLFHLVISFMKQTTLKQLLTEGERFVMTFFNVISLAEQGIYDVINNLGSLPARLVFAQIEESGYLLFSQKIDREKAPSRQNQKKLVEAGVILRNLLNMMSLLGLIIFSFGFNYSNLALMIYGGKVLGDDLGTRLLQWHCFYIVLIAVNGITECFTFAAMNQKQIDAFNKKLVVFSILFLASALALTNWFGSSGFIMANALNMLVRILVSVKFIANFFGQTNVRSPLYGLIPKVHTAATFLIVFAALYMAKVRFCCDFGISNNMIFVAIGILSLLFLLTILFVKEKELKHFVKTIMKK